MRRSICVIAFAAIGALLFAGGAQEATETAAPASEQAARTGKYGESPMLAARVQAGELPPVDDRLPENPFVASAGTLIAADDLDLEIGTYGGTLRKVTDNLTWDTEVFLGSVEPLVIGEGITGVDILPNIVEAFDVREDETLFVFYLREGLRWSDGVEVTTEDVRFTYEDVLQNTKINPVFPAFLKARNSRDGDPMELEVIDKYTFQVRFSEPYGGFLFQLAIPAWRGYVNFLKPKHYLTQFHADYTSMEELNKMIKEEQLTEDEWWTLFNQKDKIRTTLSSRTGIDFPQLYPWIPVDASQTMLYWERNPYYFKVDTEGNQLPYLDKIQTAIVQDTEVINLKIIAGEVDYEFSDLALAKVPLLLENADAQNYRLVFLEQHKSPINVFFNLTHRDPTWRSVVRDIRFRRALDMAINRAEINDALYIGRAEASQIATGTYDPQEAERLLDEMGMDERDSEGFRLAPNGEPFTVPFEVTDNAPDIVPATEVITEHWRDIGIRATMKTVAGGLLSTRQAANEVLVTLDWTERLWHNYVAYTSYAEAWPLWTIWGESGGEEGEEPPEEVQRFLRLTGESLAVAEDRREEIQRQCKDLLRENLWYIEIFDTVPYPLAVSNDIGNIAHRGYTVAANYAAEYYYFK